MIYLGFCIIAFILSIVNISSMKKNISKMYSIRAVRDMYKMIAFNDGCSAILMIFIAQSFFNVFINTL